MYNQKTNSKMRKNMTALDLDSEQKKDRQVLSPHDGGDDLQHLGISQPDP